MSNWAVCEEHGLREFPRCEICNTEWWCYWLKAWLEIGWHAKVELLASSRLRQVLADRSESYY